MPQQRFYNYGSTGTSSSENTIHYALHKRGVYRGLDLAPNTAGDGVEIGAGYALMHNGVLCYESTAFELSFSPPAVATNYTIIATHTYRELIGGDPVEYAIEVGTLRPLGDPTLDGIVIGWIRHPGGSVALDASHLQGAPKQIPEGNVPEATTLLPIELVAPMQRSYLSSIGPDLTFNASQFDVGTFTIYQEVVSSPTAVGVQTAIQQFQFYVNDAVRPDSISLYNFINAPVTTKIDVEVYGTDQVLVPVTNGTITGTAAWQTSTVSVDRTSGTFDDGKPYTVRVTYTLDPGEAIWVGRLKLNFWPYP